MKTVAKRIISVILCISMLMGMIAVGDFYDDQTYAYTHLNPDYSKNKAYSCGNYPDASTLKTNLEDDLGSEDNPFVVLEIVPTFDQGNFGYFIPGCEPVNMEAVERDYNSLQGNMGLMKDAYSVRKSDIYCLYEDIPADTPYNITTTMGWNSDDLTDYMARDDFEVGYKNENVDITYNTWYHKPESEFEREGYFVKVESGGNYSRVKVQNRTPYNKDPNDGNYYFKYDKNGEYKWYNKGDTLPDVSDTEHVVEMTRNDVFKCHVTKLVHKDIFVQKALKDKSTDFISNVITITPEDLDKEENLKLIDVADLIYIHYGNNTSVMMDIWQNYNKWGAHTDNKRYNPATFADHDLTNQEALAIMKRMGSTNPAALVFEATAVKINNRNDLNAYKLMMMVTQFKPEDFCNKLGLYSAVETASEGKDKLYYPAKKVENGEIVDAPEISNDWVPTTVNSPYSSGTFAYGPDGTDLTVSDMRFDGGNFGSYNVFDKIMTYNGDNSLLQDFLTKNDISQSQNDPLHGGNTIQDLQDYYGDKNSFSMQEIMKFILSVPQYTPKLRVLEIQPCQQFIYNSDKDNDKFTIKDNGIEKKVNWVEYYEGLFPWYESDEDSGSWVEDPERLSVTTMTTAEFIGSTGRYNYGALDSLGNPVKLTIDSSDDLIAKYDLIIIGGLQDKSNGLNGYNDEALGNLVYTSVGDLVFANESQLDNNNIDGNNYDKGIRNDFMNYKMRYSGNDITLKKMLELEDFLRAGKPIVVDQSLYTEDGSQIDDAKVDKSSKLHDLLCWDDPDGDADELIMQYNDYSPRMMRKIISSSRCQLVFVSSYDGYPLEYSYDSANQSYDLDGASGTASGVITSENYQSKDANGNAVLSYHFYIDGVYGKKYKVQLCLDSDGDGVYRGSLKEHSEITNMNAALGTDDEFDTIEKPHSMKVVDEDGNEIVNGELEPNKKYYATYTLPKTRLGIVPWKLEVYQADNEYLRSSAIDYTAFAKNGDDKASIKVLQMCLPPMRAPTRGDVSSDPYNGKNNIYENSLWKGDRFNSFTRYSVDIGDKNHQYYDPDYDYTAHSDTRILTEINKSSQKASKKATIAKFEKYLDNVGEFDVQIQLLLNSDWETLFGDNAVDAEGNILTSQQKADNWKQFLSGYDMVVLGFIDSNSFSENPVFVEGINDFISQGKSMIFSHDLVQSPDAYNVGNYGNYSPWLRTVSGQRRAYYNWDEKSKKYVKSYSSTLLNGTEIFSQSELYQYFMSNSNDTERSVLFHKFTDDYDFDSVEEEFLNTYTCEITDNSAQMYARYKSSKNSNLSVKTDRTSLAGSGGKSWSWPDNSSGTSFVRLANNGQITCYPYKLDDVISVLNTHVQNYQLDMEYEQQGDVNVWFNLTDTYDPDVSGNSELKAQSSSPNKTDAYSSKAQDSRNSFYIYNKGNITYTGSGHGDAQTNRSDCSMTDDEVKLFVNTMISAYRPPEDGPYVSIDNASAVATDGSSVIYVDYDTVKNNKADGSEEITVDSEVRDSNVVTINGQKMVKVEFTVRDDSVTEESQEEDAEDMNKTYLLNIKDMNKTDASGGYVNLGISEIVVPSGSKAKVPESQGNSSSFYKVSANETYVIYVPYSDVIEKGCLNYKFTSYSTYYREKRRCLTQQEETDLSVMILPLFNLN